MGNICDCCMYKKPDKLTSYLIISKTCPYCIESFKTPQEKNDHILYCKLNISGGF